MVLCLYMVLLYRAYLYVSYIGCNSLECFASEYTLEINTLVAVIVLYGRESISTLSCRELSYSPHILYAI
jgi:hypothetical protein